MELVKIIQAMKDHATGHIKKHKMNVDIYLDKAVGVGGEAHPDVLETIEKELNIVAMYDDQLEMLLAESSCVGLELPVKELERLFADSLSKEMLFALESKLLVQLNALLTEGKTPVLFSSRGELPFEGSSARIKFGNTLAELMARLVGKVSSRLGYVISKGGITTHTLLEKGLRVDLVNLKGQLLPGLSIVTADTCLTAKGLPVVTFPGNLGNRETLLAAWKLIEKKY